MFQTLKARRSNNGESAYIVQSSGMPFERRARKQRACSLCKLKKLKCVPSNEKDSCAKCAKQGLECSYKNAAKMDKTRASKSSEGATDLGSESSPTLNNGSEKPEQLDSDRPITVRETAVPTINNSTPPNLSHEVPDFPDNFSFADFLENDIPFNLWTLSQDDNMDISDVPNGLTSDNGESHMQLAKPYCDFPLNYPGGANDDPGKVALVPSEVSSMSTPTIAAASISEQSYWTYTFGPGSSTLSESGNLTNRDEIKIPGLRLHEPPLVEPSPAACPCLEQLMQANEDMQVKLVWGAYGLNGVTVSVDEMLQCQKDILVSCETLLGCKACSQRSDYVMLIVSMCHEMMNGIGDLSAMLSTKPQQGGSKRPRSESDARRRDLKAGGWRLDDEEEINVIQSLIGIRITRLGSLITLLEKAVKENHPAYEWVIRALRQSITEKISAIGPGGGGSGFVMGT